MKIIPYLKDYIKDNESGYNRMYLFKKENRNILREISESFNFQAYINRKALNLVAVVLLKIPIAFINKLFKKD